MPPSLLPDGPPHPGRLAEALVAQAGVPIDAWSVVAQLESEGWRDVDARPAYGDLFALGDAVYLAVERPAAVVRSEPDAQADAGLSVAMRSYGVGLMYSLPVAGQVAALVLLGYSLWASVTLTPSTATLIGVGTVGSFVLTGGLVQAMARETSRLLGAGLESQARRVGFRFAGASCAIVAVTGPALWVLNWVLPFYPPGLAAVGVLYFVLLGLLWVTLGMLYVQERILAVAVTTAAGVLPVVGVIEGFGWPVMAAQALGLSVAIAVGWAWAWRTLGASDDDLSGPLPPLPRLSTIIDTTLPFAAYGALYFTFLFTDRVVAWTAPAEDPLPFIMWFRTSYELGMDWALVVLFPLLALHPYAVRRLTTGLRAAMEGPFEGAAVQFRREYLRHAATVLVLGALAMGAGWWAGGWLAESGPWLLQTMVTQPSSQFVYLVAAPAYVLFALGLLNALVFLSEGRPLVVVQTLAVAIVVDLIVGVVASRALGAEWAAVGLLAGAAVFAVLSTRSMWAASRSADHLTYAAY